MGVQRVGARRSTQLLQRPRYPELRLNLTERNTQPVSQSDTQSGKLSASHSVTQTQSVTQSGKLSVTHTHVKYTVRQSVSQSVTQTQSVKLSHRHSRSVSHTEERRCEALRGSCE